MHSSKLKILQNKFDGILESYKENKSVFHTLIYSETIIDGLLNYVKQLLCTNNSHLASIRNSTLKYQTQKIRTDKIYWLHETHGNSFEKAFLLQIENFIGT